MKTITLMVLLGVFSILAAQTTEWYYSYDLNSTDQEAKDIVYGSDGNVYVAGTSTDQNNTDIVLISLAPDGTERWVYTYDGSATNSNDGINALIYGDDDRLYLAGHTSDSLSSDKFLVVCVDTSGTFLWDYVYYDTLYSYGEAFDVVKAPGGDIFACGRVNTDFFVSGLNSTGTEQWTYRLDGTCGSPGCDDGATALEFGSDGNVYVAGYLHRAQPNGKDIIVTSLNTGGGENWTYFYNSVDNGNDAAADIVYGTDGNLYVAGTEGWLTSNEQDIMILSLFASGMERWTYFYDGPGPKPYWGETCYEIMQGVDGDLYVAGRDGGVGNADLDFIVISVESDGASRWVYRYNGPYTNYYDMAFTLTQTPDGNVHAAGYYCGLISEFGMTTVNRESGRDLWVYRYSGEVYGGDIAYGITSDPDGYVYVAGYDWSPNPGRNLIVVKLDPPRNTDGWYNYQEYFKIGTTWYHSESEAYGVEKTNDGNFVVAGYMGGSGNRSTRDVFLMKVDVAGDTLWKRRIGGSAAEERGYSVIETADGGFAVTGYTKSYGAGVEDVYLIKTDAAGNLQWQKWYGGSAYDVGFSLLQTADQGYVIAAKTSSYGAGAGDVWVIRTNSSGDTLWTKTVGGLKPDQPSKIIQTSDEGYLITGSYGLTDGSTDLYLVKMTSNGDTLWTKHFDPNSGWDVGSDLVEVADGNVVVAGYLGSKPALLKINNQGDTLWTKSFGPAVPDGFVGLDRTTDGGFVVLRGTYFASYNFVQVLKYDAQGNLLWNDTTGVNGTYSAAGDSRGNDLVSIGENEYLVAGIGKTAGTSSNPRNVVLVRRGGQLSPIVAIEPAGTRPYQPAVYVLEQNYPNPFNPSTTIAFNLPQTSFITLQVFDIIGRKVRTLVSGRLTAGEHQTHWDGTNDAGQPVGSGVYLYRLKTSPLEGGLRGVSQSRKMLLVR